MLPIFPHSQQHLSGATEGLNRKRTFLFTGPVWLRRAQNNGVHCGAIQCFFNVLWQGASGTNDSKASGLSPRLLMTALCNCFIPTLCLSAVMICCSRCEWLCAYSTCILQGLQNSPSRSEVRGVWESSRSRRARSLQLIPASIKTHFTLARLARLELRHCLCSTRYTAEEYVMCSHKQTTHSARSSLVIFGSHAYRVNRKTADGLLAGVDWYSADRTWLNRPELEKRSSVL